MFPEDATLLLVRALRNGAATLSRRSAEGSAYRFERQQPVSTVLQAPARASVQHGSCTVTIYEDFDTLGFFATGSSV